ncbi:MAG TPA: hypothetical protein VEC76_02535 [Streptosporangiaceae bacterium]|nr:hypothetical protein [Streptosporangiaceae bacterium]
MSSRASAALRRVSTLRVAAHVLVWLPFILALARSLHDGWRPVSDNAGIALRSWDVLTAHAPLVGQATRLAHGVYDPGPLQYWLLTLPVHIDPVHGVLWGGALWCMVAASLTIEAAWSAAGRLGGLLATAAVLGVIAWIPQITMLPCWNPWFGIMYLLAAIAACVAVLCGHRRWWPVLVVAGSIAAQAHLMFTITAVALVVLGLGVGLVETYRARAGYGWAVTGLVVGLVCWSAPLIQQATGRTGNLSALLHGQGPPGSQAGIGFGLKALAASAQPPPFWWTPESELLKLSRIDSRSAAVGLVILVLAVAVLAAAAYWLRSRRAAAVAAVSLTVAVTTMVMYSHIPKSSIIMTTTSVNNLRYLMAPMYPVGVLFWLAAGVVVVLAVRRVRRPAESAAPARAGQATAPAAAAPVAAASVAGASTATASATTASTAGEPPAPAAPWPTRIVAVSAVALIGLAVLAGVAIVRSPISQYSSMGVVGAASQQIEHKISGRRIMLTVVAPNNPSRRQVTFGLAYALHAAGYHPEIRTIWGLQLGPFYVFHGQPMTHVTVWMRDSGSVSSVNVTNP